MGSQGAVQVPVSALLVFLVGRATPGYGGERIADTLIGAGVAVIAVLLSPSAPGPDAGFWPGQFTPQTTPSAVRSPEYNNDGAATRRNGSRSG